VWDTVFLQMSQLIVYLPRPIEMAVDFPHVQFHGLDIVPISQRTDLPDNVQFEIHDINEPTRFPENSVELVHARSVSMTVCIARLCLHP
jgi:hypothetical protein